MKYLNNNLENYANYMNDIDLYETFKDELNKNSNIDENLNNNDENLKSDKKIYTDKFIDKTRNEIILNCGCSIDEVDKILNLVIEKNSDYEEEIEMLTDEVDKKCVKDNLDNLVKYFSSKNENLNNNSSKKVNKESNLTYTEPELISEGVKYQFNMNFFYLILILLFIIYVFKFIN